MVIWHWFSTAGWNSKIWVELLCFGLEFIDRQVGLLWTGIKVKCDQKSLFLLQRVQRLKTISFPLSTRNSGLLVNEKTTGDQSSKHRCRRHSSETASARSQKLKPKMAAQAGKRWSGQIKTPVRTIVRVHCLRGLLRVHALCLVAYIYAISSPEPAIRVSARDYRAIKAVFHCSRPAWADGAFVFINFAIQIF